jgi:hypothetical protein
LVKTCHLIWLLFEQENLLISYSTQFEYLKTTPQPDLFQNKLLLMSLSKVWNENERFRLVFTKMLVFVPKTGSLHTGTVLGYNDGTYEVYLQKEINTAHS